MTQRLAHRFLRAAAVATSTSLALAAACLGAAPTAVAEPSVLAADDFNRSVPTGWGTTSSGVRYVGAPTSATSVSAGQGRFALQPGMTASNALSTVQASDSTIALTVSTGSAVTAGDGVTTSLALRSKDGYEYQARAWFTTRGRVITWISRFDGSAAREVVLGSHTLVHSGLSAGARMRVEFSVSGLDAVSLQTRAYPLGASAPSWQVSAVDRSSARLARAGSTAVRAYVAPNTPAPSLAVDDLLLTGVAAAPTPTPPPAPAPAPATTTVGSQPVGSTSYPVPSNAVWVRAAGTSGGAGTSANPYNSFAEAVTRAPAGSTLVLRGGTYHESVRIPHGKKLIVQSAPKEAVWFDGSSKITNWAKSGTSWVSTGWKHNFPSRVSFTAGKDESHRFVDATNPMAGHAEQLWVNGVAQKQVGSASQVTKGTFYVDEAADKLILGTDPSGQTVHASTLDKALRVQADDSVLRGFGVRRYATHLDLMGTVSAETNRITLENLVVTQNATVGVYAWGSDHVLRNITASDNGLMGLGANKATRLKVLNSVFERNNVEQFKPAPVAGGVKITTSQGATVSGSSFVNNVRSSGLWFDESAYDMKVLNNVARGNGTTGIQAEISSKAVIADNYVHGNATGIQLIDASHIDVWNNTLVNNKRTMAFIQDSRRQTNAGLVATVPWVMRNVSVVNNVLSYGTDPCPILTQDYTKTWYGNDFGVSLNGNLYHRATTSAPSNLACWANGSAGTRSFKNLSDFRKHTGSDANSAAREGASVVDSAGRLSSTAAGTSGLSPRGLTAVLATALGMPSGTAKVGQLTP